MFLELLPPQGRFPQPLSSLALLGSGYSQFIAYSFLLTPLPPTQARGQDSHFFLIQRETEARLGLAVVVL